MNWSDNNELVDKLLEEKAKNEHNEKLNQVEKQLNELKTWFWKFCELYITFYPHGIGDDNFRWRLRVFVWTSKAKPWGRHTYDQDPKDTTRLRVVQSWLSTDSVASAVNDLDIISYDIDSAKLFTITEAANNWMLWVWSNQYIWMLKDEFRFNELLEKWRNENWDFKH